MQYIMRNLDILKRILVNFNFLELGLKGNSIYVSVWEQIFLARVGF